VNAPGGLQRKQALPPAARDIVMIAQRQVVFWLVALVLLVAGLYVLRDMLLPFVAGLALAYLLDPLADRLERLGFNRLWATLVILGIFILIFIIALVLLVPIVVNQLAAFIGKLPETVSRLQQLAAEQGGTLLEKLGGPEVLQDVQQSLGNVVSEGARWLGTFLQSLWSGGQAIVNVFALLVVTPVVAFYLLVDWDRMIATLDSWLPRRHAPTIRQLAREMDGAIAGFIRGQALVCIILGTFYAAGLTLVGLNFGALIGFSAGLISFIPYVGSLTGLVLSVGVAIVQFWPDYIMVGATLAIFFAGQFLEGNILSPKLVGHAVGLHPVWLMFALFAFGSLFGFVGLLLAVPIAAALGVLARFAVRQYLASSLYDEGMPPPSRPETDA